MNIVLRLQNTAKPSMYTFFKCPFVARYKLASVLIVDLSCEACNKGPDVGEFQIWSNGVVKALQEFIITVLQIISLEP